MIRVNQVGEITSPGMYLDWYLKLNSISRKKMADMLSISVYKLNNIIRGKVIITKDLAFNLELATDIRANSWLRFEKVYRNKLKKYDMYNKLRKHY